MHTVYYVPGTNLSILTYITSFTFPVRLSTVSVPILQ